MLAQDVYYERTAQFWNLTGHFGPLYGFKNGKLISTVVMSPGPRPRNITRNTLASTGRLNAGV